MSPLGLSSASQVSQACHLTAEWVWFSRIHWYSEKLVCNRLLSRTMHAPSVLITQCSLAEKTRGNQQVNSFHYPRHYVNGKALFILYAAVSFLPPVCLSFNRLSLQELWEDDRLESLYFMQCHFVIRLLLKYSFTNSDYRYQVILSSACKSPCILKNPVTEEILGSKKKD